MKSHSKLLLWLLLLVMIGVSVYSLRNVQAASHTAIGDAVPKVRQSFSAVTAIDLQSGSKRQVSFLIVAISIIVIPTLVLLKFRPPRFMWAASIAFSLLSVLGMIFIWVYISIQPSDSDPKNHIVTSTDELNKYLSVQDTVVNAPKNDPVIYIPTGIFIQSFQFIDANDVSVTGYVWQKFDDKFPPTLHKGFIFPEINATIEQAVAYDHQIGSIQTIGWRFHTILREQFFYAQYPFDRQQIWIRIWPIDFEKNVILVLDLAAYNTADALTPGIENDFVLENWISSRSYFWYRNNSYNMNFGMNDYTGQQNFPELYFNLDIQRSIVPTFVGDLLPVVVTHLLLFFVLALPSRDSEHIAVFGTDTLSVLLFCTSLFFIAILLQYNVRNSIHSDSVMYIEYFYFTIYAGVLYVALDFILYALGGKHPIIAFRKNLIPRVLYLPIMLGSLFVITVLAFYTY